MDKVATMVPSYQTIYAKAQEICEYSVETAQNAWETSCRKVQHSRKQYAQFSKDAKVCWNNIVRETVDEFLQVLEFLAKVEKK